MKSEGLRNVLLTLWVGGLWVTGYMVAPLLFSNLTDRMLAGMLAGKMFTAISWVGFFCGFYLLIDRAYRAGAGALKDGFFWTVILMLVLTAATHFGIQPVIEHLKEEAMPRDVMQSVFKDRFRTWHGISSIVYLIESFLGIYLVVAKR